jgi:hypothetical protein
VPLQRVSSTLPAVFDLNRYLERIGLSSYSGLAGLHRAHATSIPFENLDPHGGLHVSLEVRDLQRKLVNDRRGGYCFEQNLLLKAALQELGADQDGTRTMLSDWSELSLTKRTPVGQDTVIAVVREQIPVLLAERFGLAGFALNDDGRIVRA